MTLSALKTLLSTLGMPVAFDHFKTAQVLPYMAFIVGRNNIFAADNQVYHSDPVIQLELYTELKDEEKETDVETLLKSVPFVFAKEEGYLADEQMYMVTYTFTL